MIVSITISVTITISITIKDLPRTFPDHPALDGRGRSALGRVLAAYVAYNNEGNYSD